MNVRESYSKKLLEENSVSNGEGNNRGFLGPNSINDFN
jgi:hypothetical protein